ncbi:MAG: cytochrome b/b6 domain-containing protein [Microbacterium arborescens]
MRTEADVRAGGPDPIRAPKPNLNPNLERDSSPDLDPGPDRGPSPSRRPNSNPNPTPTPDRDLVGGETAPRPPLTVVPTAWPGRAAAARLARPRRPVGEFGRRPEPERVGAAEGEPRRYGPAAARFTLVQWAGVVFVVGVALVLAAGMGVALVRWLLSLDGPQEFLARYPGEYPLPAGAPVGLPAWLGWQHAFNAFLMVLIIRSGLQVRREKRPRVFWSPRGRPKRKTSLTIWFHQALDVLWVSNGLLFVVLLFATGQWMRIVPTSPEVVPNALSAALQYVSLDWPTENGWVNYNSLQQLAYFTTVFVAAPLAVLSGIRMSTVWPRGDRWINRVYPIEWARRVHVPVMVFFVVFIAIHVLLVLATGALRNLNHMYAAQGSVDPTAYADNWTGFWMFVLSLAVIVGGWAAARPVILSPIARLFGTVVGR